MGGKIKAFILDRLDERSTWRAIVALLTLAGLGLEPSQSEAIITAGIAIGAALEALLPDPSGRIREPNAKSAGLPDTDAVPPAPVADAERGRPRADSASDVGRKTWLGD